MKNYEEVETGLLRRREPMSFMLMLGFVSIGLTFFGLLVAVLSLSYQKKIAWTAGKMPSIFWLSSVLIVLSSFALEQADKYVKSDNFLAYRRMLSATLLLGILFIILQIQGWRELQAVGIYIKGGFLGAFVYIISGLHILHVVGGMFFLIWRTIVSYQKSAYLDAYIYNINPPNQLKFKLLKKYWHFIGGIWIGLFLFMLFMGFTTF